MIKFTLLIFILCMIVSGGSQWEKRSVNLTSCDISKILFLNKDTGFVFGDSGFIARTTNSGDTWDKASLSQDIRINDACFIPPNLIMAVGENGNFFTSDDYGEKWNMSLVNLHYDNIRVFSFDGKNIWIGAEFGTLFHSIDSGTKWNEIKLTNNGTIFSICFINQNSGWIAGESGLLFYTTNGGQEWIEAEQKASEVFNEIYFKDMQTGWVIGDRIQYSIDGGKTWVIQQDRIYQVMRGMCFTDSLNAFVAADYSKMIVSTDGGLTWDTTSMDIPYVYPLDIAENGNDLWIVGRNGLLCKSSKSSAAVVKQAYVNFNRLAEHQGMYNLSGQKINSFSPINQLIIAKDGSKYKTISFGGNAYLKSGMRRNASADRQ